MIQQVEITLRPHARGFHLVTEEIVRQLPPLPQTGLLNLFIQHTSAALSINENCDPDVRDDMEQIFNRLIRERESWYTHTLEGWDDMPAHAKSTMIGGKPVSSGHSRAAESGDLAGHLSLRVPQSWRSQTHCRDNYWGVRGFSRGTERLSVK